MRPGPDAVPGFGDRIGNIFRMNFRGIFGFIVPFAGLIWQGERLNHAKTVKCMWLWMIWCCLLQPVHIPIVGLIPVFVIPMTGIIDSQAICIMYINESVVLFLLSTMVNMLLNNSGFDRRVELSIIRSGDNAAYNPRKLVFKSATAAFVMSIFSNRLIVASDIITFLAPPLLELKGSPDADFNNVRAVVCTAVHVGASLGSCIFPHGSMCIIYMRMMFHEAPATGFDYPDIFNYMQFILYAFPVSLLMFLFSTIYFMILVGGKTVSPASLAKIGDALNKHQATIPKHITLHEKETLFFLFIFLIMCLTRWCKFMNMGWSSFTIDPQSPSIPWIKDSVCCAILVLALFSLPKGASFMKYLSAKTYKELPPARAESAILFWRFVDKNVQYGYIFLYGAGCVIARSCTNAGPGFPAYQEYLTNDLGKIVTDHSWNVSIFIVCLVSVILANVMPGIAACMCWCPFVVNMAREGAPNNWDTKLYLGLIGCGFGATLGFMCPFLHTPAYFTHTVGKTTKVKMAKTAIGAVIICFIILWLSLIILAPYLWDPNNDGGFVAIEGPDRTTVAPGKGGGAGGGGAPPPPPPPPPPPDD